MSNSCCFNANKNDKNSGLCALNCAWWTLRMLFAVAFIGAGLDKFFNFVVTWGDFINVAQAQSIGISPVKLIYAQGVIEIIIGVLFLTKWVRLAAVLAALWFFIMGFYLLIWNKFLDTAARYTAFGIVSLALARLTCAKEKLEQTPVSSVCNLSTCKPNKFNNNILAGH